MPTGPRPLSNNVAACIGEIIALALGARATLVDACDVAQKRYQDIGLLADLHSVERAVNDIELHARNAQRNKYEQRSRK